MTPTTVSIEVVVTSLRLVIQNLVHTHLNTCNALNNFNLQICNALCFLQKKRWISNSANQLATDNNLLISNSWTRHLLLFSVSSEQLTFFFELRLCIYYIHIKLTLAWNFNNQEVSWPYSSLPYTFPFPFTLWP